MSLLEIIREMDASSCEYDVKLIDISKAAREAHLKQDHEGMRDLAFSHHNWMCRSFGQNPMDPKAILETEDTFRMVCNVGAYQHENSKLAQAVIAHCTQQDSPVYRFYMESAMPQLIRE